MTATQLSVNKAIYLFTVVLKKRKMFIKIVINDFSTDIPPLCCRESLLSSVAQSLLSCSTHGHSHLNIYSLSIIFSHYLLPFPFLKLEFFILPHTSCSLHLSCPFTFLSSSGWLTFSPSLSPSLLHTPDSLLLAPVCPKGLIDSER